MTIEYCKLMNCVIISTSRGLHCGSTFQSHHNRSKHHFPLHTVFTHGVYYCHRKVEVQVTQEQNTVLILMQNMKISENI